MRGDIILFDRLLGKWILTELSAVILKVLELSQAPGDLYAGWFYSIWTVYWVNRVFLNCILIVLNVAEFTQALADL